MLQMWVLVMGYADNNDRSARIKGIIDTVKEDLETGWRPVPPEYRKHALHFLSMCEEVDEVYERYTKARNGLINWDKVFYENTHQ